MPMSRSIVEQLFFGEICPSEHIGKDSPEYQKAQSLLADEKAKFSQELSDNNRENFQKLEELQNKAAGIYSYECFANGYRLGIALLLGGRQCGWDCQSTMATKANTDEFQS